MNKLYALVLFPLVFSLHLGCGTRPSIEGQPTPEKPKTPTAAPKKQPEERIHFHFVRASNEDPTVPDLLHDATAPTSPERLTSEQNMAVFHDKISLPDPFSVNPEHHKEVFLVWSDQLDGSTIQNATFTFRAKDAQNRWLNVRPPAQAWHDIERQRWYIPISTLYENPEYTPDHINLQETQTLSLDMLLKSGPNRTAEIRFHALPAIPNFALQTTGIPVPPTPQALVFEVSNEMWTFFQQRITNPTQRPFKLWLNIPSNQRFLEIQSFLSPRHRVAQNIINEYGFPNFELRTMAELRMTQIAATRSSGEREIIPIVYDTWIPITLPANETLTLAWGSIPAPGTRRCPIPQAFNHRFSKQVTLDDPFLPRDFFGRAQTYKKQVHTDVLLSYGFIGAEVTGALDYEVRMTHEFTPEALATAKEGAATDYRLLKKEVVPLDVRQGVLYHHAAPYQCQGVFGREVF